jgi:hypothetical protein
MRLTSPTHRYKQEIEDKNYSSFLYNVVLGDEMVIVLATGPKVHGFKPC